MKRILLWAAAVAFLSASQLSGPAAFAQQYNGPGVAIIDLTRIFKNHARLKLMLDDIRTSVVNAEENLKGKKAEIEGHIEKQKQFRPESPEYKQYDELITRQRVELNSNFAIQKKEFAEREAKTYYTVYKEALDATQWYANQKGIYLVLRFSGDPVNDTDPQDILKHLNKPVFYNHPAVDITEAILTELNRGQAVTNAPRGPTGVPLPGTQPGIQQPPRTGVLPQQPPRTNTLPPR